MTAPLPPSEGSVGIGVDLRVEPEDVNPVLDAIRQRAKVRQLSGNEALCFELALASVVLALLGHQHNITLESIVDSLEQISEKVLPEIKVRMQ